SARCCARWCKGGRGTSPPGPLSIACQQWRGGANAEKDGLRGKPRHCTRVTPLLCLGQRRGAGGEVPVPERIPIDEFNLRTLPTGRKARYWLDAFPTLGGDVRLPALVVTGAQPGPVLLAVAAVHGNEYEGQEAVRAVFER